MKFDTNISTVFASPVTIWKPLFQVTIITSHCDSLKLLAIIWKPLKIQPHHCRYSILKRHVDGINKNEGGMNKFTQSFKRYGLQRVENGIMCREWCPGASAVFIMGEFSELLCFVVRLLFE